jgi:hypothetical protein
MGELPTLVLLGFSLGLVHALDADHVMAVTVLSNSKPGFARTLRHCAHWALGHGLVLLTAGLLLFGLGVAIPPGLVWLAEVLVGMFLVGMGLFCFWRFRRERIVLVEHRHGELTHRHWQVEGDPAHARASADDRAGHAPVMVGMLHGLAGSAPALALVPVVAQGQVAAALGYLLLFSFGVMLAMLAFGLGFGRLQQWLGQSSVSLMNGSRHLIALTSITIGGFWLSQAL